MFGISGFPRFVYLDSFRESLLWTYREWRAGNPLPPNLAEWRHLDSDEDFYRRVTEVFHAWQFLAPFFATRGLTLYVNRNRPYHPFELFPAPSTSSTKGTIEPTYPFARRVYTSDDDVVFDFSSLRAWPARDSAGRDVVIKVVSGPTPSMELKILEWLNSPKVRADPRNISIPVLEYIKYNSYIFVVMPRWDIGWEHKFYTVADLMHAMGSYLQGVDFLHENRIAHCDLRTQNIGLNILGKPADGGRLARDPAHALYTIFDFGGSFMYPRDTPLEEAKPLEENANGDINPFQVDVALLGSAFQAWLKPAKELLPEIVLLSQEMMHVEPKKRLSARQALERFEVIRSSLNIEQLERAIPNRLKGK